MLFKQLAPEMVVPAGQTVHLSLRSPDVIHAFYVPQFLFKRDVVPGRDNAFDFIVEPEFAGQTFRGQCAELCGTFHDAMQFSVKAMTPADYEAWLQQQIAAAQRLAAAAAVGRPARPGRPGRVPGPARRRPQSVSRGGTTVELSASERPRSTRGAQAPANTAFTLAFTNNDAGVPPQRRDPAGPARAILPVRRRDLPRASTAALPDPAARRRHVRVQVQGASEHDRHADGPVREPRWRPPR